jgi:hypothetical protein
MFENILWGWRMGRVRNSGLCTVACFDGTGVTFCYRTVSSSANTNYTWKVVKNVLIATSETSFLCLYLLHLMAMYQRNKAQNPRVVIGLLTGHNTLRRNLHQWGFQTVYYVGGVVQRMKPRPTFFMNVKLWLHSDMSIWASFLGREDVKCLCL